LFLIKERRFKSSCIFSSFFLVLPCIFLLPRYHTCITLTFRDSIKTMSSHASNHPHHSGGHAGGHAGGGASPAAAVAGLNRPEEISQSLPIPERKMGWIVGKKGSYINQLARKSGATITISESTSREYGMVWKYVQLTGTGRAVDRAKKLIHIRLDRLEPRSSSSAGGPVDSNEVSPDASATDVNVGNLRVAEPMSDTSTHNNEEEK
jgi:hypothetical protein